MRLAKASSFFLQSQIDVRLSTAWPRSIVADRMNYMNSLRVSLAIMTLALVCTTAAQAQPKPLSPKEPGSPWPEWELTDFQPKSLRFNETYGLNHFRG